MDVKYFNENNGLRNNTVLSVAFDGQGNLWAGLDSGIDHVCLSSPFTNLYSYPYSYGTGYAAAVENGYLYLGTNRGLYYTSYPVKLNGSLPDIHPFLNPVVRCGTFVKLVMICFVFMIVEFFRLKVQVYIRITDITGACAVKRFRGDPIVCL